MNIYIPLEKLVKLNILSLTPSSFGSNSFILLLQDVNEAARMFPIVIGSTEAQAISIVRDEIAISRPLTHQLFTDLLVNTNFKLEKIVIVDFKEGIFYSNMYFTNQSSEFILDARPSDAIAIALRTNSTIYINEKLLNSISIPVESHVDDLDEEDEIDIIEINQSPSIEDLQKSLEKALLEENYELAAQIRDSINKIK